MIYTRLYMIAYDLQFVESKTISTSHNWKLKPLHKNVDLKDEHGRKLIPQCIGILINLENTLILKRDVILNIVPT